MNETADVAAIVNSSFTDVLPSAGLAVARYAAPTLAITAPALAVAAPGAVRAPGVAARAPVVGPCKPDQYDPLGRDVAEFRRDEKYSCHHHGCGKQFKTRRHRNEHHRQSHMGVKVRCPYGCGKKYQSFNRPSNLAKHFSGRVGSKRHHRDQMALRLRQPHGDGGDGDAAFEGEALAFAQQLFRDARGGTAQAPVPALMQVEVAELPFPFPSGYL